MKKILIGFFVVAIALAATLSEGPSYKSITLKNAGSGDTAYVNGKAWYNSAYNHFTFIENGTAKHLGASGGGGGTTGSFFLRGNGAGGFYNLVSPSDGQLIMKVTGPDFANSGVTSDGTNITAGIWHGTKIDTIYGGTNLTSYTTGDILYASASNVLSKLAIGTNNYVLKVSGGVPTWAPASGGGITNSAANTELMKSDGTNAVSSGIFSPSTSLLVMGTTGDSIYTKSIDAAANNASTSEIKLIAHGTSGKVTLSPDNSHNVEVSWDGTNSLINGGSNPIKISTSGAFLINASVINLEPATNGNISLFTSSGSFGSGEKVIFIHNATTDPTTNPTGGGILYVSGGALKYRGSSGTVTTIANA